LHLFTFSHTLTFQEQISDPFCVFYTSPPILRKISHYHFLSLKNINNGKSVYSAEENWIIVFTCNVTKKHFVTLFFISLRYVIRYVTIFNFSLRYFVTLHKFFVTFRFFRYVTFRVQIPALNIRFFLHDLLEFHVLGPSWLPVAIQTP
jgi:hypothetical protein